MGTRSKKVEGSLFAATKEGFQQLLDEANEIADRYRLVTVVRLDKAIAAVYVEHSDATAPPTPVPSGSSFFED
jgi:hypothetical protein